MGDYLGEEGFSDDLDPGWGRPPGSAAADEDWRTPWDDDPVEPPEVCADCGRVCHAYLCPTWVEQGARGLTRPGHRRAYAAAGCGTPEDELEWYAMTLSGEEEAHWLAVVRRAKQILKAEPVSKPVTALEYLARHRQPPASAPPPPATRPGKRKHRAAEDSGTLFVGEQAEEGVSRRKEKR